VGTIPAKAGIQGKSTGKRLGKERSIHELGRGI
jgi:hypothetical protein